MKLRNKITNEEAPYIEGETEFNPDIWGLTEGEINIDEFINQSPTLDDDLKRIEENNE